MVREGLVTSLPRRGDQRAAPVIEQEVKKRDHALAWRLTALSWRGILSPPFQEAYLNGAAGGGPSPDPVVSVVHKRTESAQGQRIGSTAGRRAAS